MKKTINIRSCLRKMLSNLFAVILVGGFPVLWTYFVAIRQPQRVKEQIYVPDVMYRFWLVSMVLTVVSYLVLAYTFVFGGEDIFQQKAKDVEPYLCAVYLLFLASAGHWVYCVLLDIEYGRKSNWHLINLYATACMSVLIALLAFGIKDNVVAKLSGVWLAFHHLVFDAMLWFNMWEPEY